MNTASHLTTLTGIMTALAVLGSGCALTQPTDPCAGMTSRPNPIVGGQSTSARQPVLGPLTLAEAIRLALANNPEVAAAEHDTTAAGASRDMAAVSSRSKTRLDRGHYLAILASMLDKRNLGLYGATEPWMRQAGLDTKPERRLSRRSGMPVA